MIDPRALQQHFKKVHQRQEPKKVPIPRIPDLKPLTAIEAILVPEPIIKQENLPVQSPSKEPINLTIEFPPPIGDLIIDEEEEVFLEAEDSGPKEVLEVERPKIENPYGYSGSSGEENDYDPYSYYSGPKF